MFKLSRAFAVSAVLSWTVLCAPVPQDSGKPFSIGKSVNSSAPASTVFTLTTQDPNSQTHPVGFCVVPALAREAGLSQGQGQLLVHQAVELCPEAKIIAVSYKGSKRSLQAPNGDTPVPPPYPELCPDTPRPAVARSQVSPPNSQILPQTKPLPPRQVAARSDSGQLPNNKIPPPPVSESLPSAPKFHAPRDLPQPGPVYQLEPVPVPEPEAPHPVAARSLVSPPPPNPKAPQPEPLPLHPAAVRSVPEQPSKVEAPALEPTPDSSARRPPVVARSQGHLQPVTQAQKGPVPVSRHPHRVVARSEPHQVPRPNSEVPPQLLPQPGAPLSGTNSFLTFALRTIDRPLGLLRVYSLLSYLILFLS
ncbi:hypothetical protein RSOL_448760 [Rhizoctonia solani AG-3 Rhs1AP]|uniref:Transmembrane protein n=1 Tax=Rhizoctonia solani AG-3 Rhs1AP TaxID=1086054 RepID=X8JPI1_9AGAM|nr:hypothetical protein RSOL_448760 [Rhizoctonia solani AG-3 Rhs1AP]